METDTNVNDGKTEVLRTDVGEEESVRLYYLQEGNPDALVLHCSDPRFQGAFHNFLEQELNVKMPAKIVIPGSVSSFGVQTFLPKGWHAMRKQIELMAAHSKFPRVILINHDDCKGYAKIAQFIGGMSRVVSEQRKHLKLIGRYIREQYLPHAQFELYHAKIVQKDNDSFVEFERII